MWISWNLEAAIGCRMKLDSSILENSPLFHGLDGAALDGLMRLARPVTLKPGKTLFMQGDPSEGCYIILEGVLKICAVSEDGEEALLSVVDAGDIIGEMGLIDGIPRSASVEALKCCSLAYLSTRDFTRFAKEKPAVYQHMLKIVCARLRASNDAFAAYQLLPISGRIARVLLRLAEGFGEPLNGGRILIRQNLTQAELAKMSGATRENVSRRLKEMSKAGVISRISSYYCIENAETLRELGKL